MQTFQTDGIVLKVRHTGESDRIVTVLTRDFGVIHAFAKAARRPKSKLHSGTQSFCFSDFSFSLSGETYKITEAVPKQVFYALHDDIAGLALAQYIGQIACELAGSDEQNAENLRLVLNSLHYLCVKTKPAAFIKAVTELRLCANSGYAPDLSGCAKCGRTAGVWYLNCGEGVLVCRSCSGVSAGIPLPEEVRLVMEHIVTGEFEQIYSIIPSEKNIEVLEEISEKYLMIQTERSYSALDFYKSLRI